MAQQGSLFSDHSDKAQRSEDVLGPQYGIIAQAIKRRNIILFLGAGASMSGNPGNLEWNEEEAEYLPSAHQLAMKLADDAGLDLDNKSEIRDLAKISSFYQLSSLEPKEGRAGLKERLRSVFNQEYPIGKIHSLLSQLDIPLVVTTNYDDQLERAFLQRNKRFHLVVHNNDDQANAASIYWWKPDKHGKEPELIHPNNLHLDPDDLQRESIIYKMHGSMIRNVLGCDSFVVTEEDYVKYLARMVENDPPIPRVFMEYFITRPFLFLGYGLQDWNIRVMLTTLRDKLMHSHVDRKDENEQKENARRIPKSIAVQLKSTPVERALWAARGVETRGADIDDFAERLAEKLGITSLET